MRPRQSRHQTSGRETVSQRDLAWWSVPNQEDRPGTDHQTTHGRCLCCYGTLSSERHCSTGSVLLCVTATAVGTATETKFGVGGEGATMHIDQYTGHHQSHQTVTVTATVTFTYYRPALVSSPCHPYGRYKWSNHFRQFLFDPVNFWVGKIIYARTHRTYG